jgi:hypothetical protein
MTPSIQTGTLSETVIELDVIKHGYNILFPKVTTRYDRIIDLGTEFKRIQIKTARVDKRDNNLRVTFDVPYDPLTVDYFAVYSPSNDEIYYVPITDIPPTAKGFTIRVTPRKNKRVTGSLTASDYTKFPF